MADPDLLARPAVKAETLSGNGIMLTVPRPGAVIQVLGIRGSDIGERLRRFAGEGKDHAVRPLAPGQWLLVLAEPLGEDALARLRDAVGDAALVDQTHGRTCLCVEGVNAEKVLAKGTAVDLHPAAFPVGAATTTLFGHIAAHLTRTGEHRFELLVLRGFAESLWDDLALMAAEFL